LNLVFCKEFDADSMLCGSRTNLLVSNLVESDLNCTFKLLKELHDLLYVLYSSTPSAVIWSLLIVLKLFCRTNCFIIYVLITGLEPVIE